MGANLKSQCWRRVAMARKAVQARKMECMGRSMMRTPTTMMLSGTRKKFIVVARASIDPPASLTRAGRERREGRGSGTGFRDVVAAHDAHAGPEDAHADFEDDEGREDDDDGVPKEDGSVQAHRAHAQHHPASSPSSIPVPG